MHQALSICTMGPTVALISFCPPLTAHKTATAKDPTSGKLLGWRVTSPCSPCKWHLFICVSLYLKHMLACVYVSVTQADTCKSCPFMTACTHWHELQRPRCHIAAEVISLQASDFSVTLFSHFFYHPFCCFPRGILPLLPSAGMACILID